MTPRVSWERRTQRVTRQTSDPAMGGASRSSQVPATGYPTPGVPGVVRRIAQSPAIYGGPLAPGPTGKPSVWAGSPAVGYLGSGAREDSDREGMQIRKCQAGRARQAARR